MPIPDIDYRSGELQARLDREIAQLESIFEKIGYTEDEIRCAMLAVVLARMKMGDEKFKTFEAIEWALKATEGH